MVHAILRDDSGIRPYRRGQKGEIVGHRPIADVLVKCLDGLQVDQKSTAWADYLRIDK